MTSDDVCLGLLPMFHIYGLNCVLGQAVRQGARVLLVDGFDPGGLLGPDRGGGGHQHPAGAARRGGLGRTRRPARQARPGHDDPVRCLGRSIPSSPRRSSPSSGKHIEQGYGLTETAPVIATTFGSPRAEGAAPKPGSVGRPLPGVELRIVEANGHDAAAGDPAEIWVKGDNLFSGYWPDGVDGPDATTAGIRTGDIGFLDEDGDLTLVDRLTRAGHRLGVQRLSVRGRGRHRRGRRRRAGRGRRPAGRGDRRGRRGIRRAARTPRRRRDHDRRGGRGALPYAAGAVQAARSGSWSCRACRTRPPARSPRVGCAHSPAARRSASTHRDASPHSGDARVVVYSRPGCHLCEVAEAQVAEICAETGDTWARVDITTDDDLTSRFTEQVPGHVRRRARSTTSGGSTRRLRKALAR